MIMRPRLITLALAAGALLSTGVLSGSAAHADPAVSPAVPSSSRVGNQYGITLDMSECDVMATGVTGTCIISLQSWLDIFDNAGLTIDGNFGPTTEVAVKDFQSRHGLVPDGRFGDSSRNALRGVYQDMAANSVPTPRPIALDSKDFGAVEPGLQANNNIMSVAIIAVACEGVGIVAGLITGPIGAAAGTACSILLG